MELYEAVSRRMGIPEVVIRGSMGYMKQSRIFVVTFLGVLDPVRRILSTPQVSMCLLDCRRGCGVLRWYVRVSAGKVRECAGRVSIKLVLLLCRVPFLVQTWRRL